MITDTEKWLFLAVKCVSALFKGITSKHVRDFYWLNCLHSFRTENKHKNCVCIWKLWILLYRYARRKK